MLRLTFPPSGYSPMPISAHEIAQYTLCRCALYLDHHGPSEHRGQTHAFLSHLQALGRTHEATIASSLPYVPVPVSGSLTERAQYTLDLLKQGTERIYQPVLAHSDLLGIPDFLERIDTPSILGPFSYRPVDVKLSTSAHPEHIASLAFYGLLLGRVQGVIPETGDLILLDGSRATIPLADQAPKVEQAISEVQAIRNGRIELPTLSSECGMCPWGAHCLQVLKANQDLSLLNGLSRGRKGALNGAGYFTLSNIVDADPQALSEVRGIGEKTAERMVVQAEVLLRNEPRRIAVPDLRNEGVELFLDLECAHSTQVIYLIGVLEVGQNGTGQYRAFVAEDAGQEGAMWAEFLDYLNGLPEDLVIYHYHCFEAVHLRKLAGRHGIVEELKNKLLGNLVDLHSVLRASVVLPVYSYGLKSVTKWMGFVWRETGSDAAMSMLWFDLWLSTKDRRYLDLAVEYNEDDCRATRVVREWVGEMGQEEECA